MKKISDVIDEKLFKNAFYICEKYMEKVFMTDINLILLKNAMKGLTENNVVKYYDTFVKTELFYSVPYLFSSDKIEIPKKINGLREYRFFSLMSMIMYNSVGLLFVDICNSFIDSIDFKGSNIYHFSPTKFVKDDKMWTSKNEYKDQYKKYIDKIKESTEVGDIVLKIDIKNYFDTMKHTKIISLLDSFGVESNKSRYDIDQKAKDALLFYFESVMKKKHRDSTR